MIKTIASSGHGSRYALMQEEKLYSKNILLY